MTDGSRERLIQPKKEKPQPIWLTSHVVKKKNNGRTEIGLLPCGIAPFTPFYSHQKQTAKLFEMIVFVVAIRNLSLKTVDHVFGKATNSQQL